MSKLGDKDSCSCNGCTSACHNKPGWFMPGEAEKVAKYLNISSEKLFRTKLMVDWFEKGSELPKTAFILAPAIVNKKAGREYPASPHGQCIFLKYGKCDIHAVKPFECKQLIHDEGEKVNHERHLAVAKAWASKQLQIKKLLGRKPKAKEYGVLDYIIDMEMY